MRLGNSRIEFGARSEMRNYKNDKRSLKLYLPGQGRLVVTMADDLGPLVHCTKDRVTLASS